MSGQSPELQQLIKLIRSRPLPERPTVAFMRQTFEAMMSRMRVPADVIREAISAGGRPAERLAAPGAERGRVVLYLHGGAYVIGSIDSHRELAARVGRAACASVVNVDYRLAPEHPFPAALDDAVAAYRWILEQGFAPANVAIAGDSAGGGLTVATLLALRDAGAPLPGAAVCLSPWLDLAGEGESLRTNAPADPIVNEAMLFSMAAHYLGDTPRTHPLASPIHADLAGLPPLLVQVSTTEALHDDSVRLAARARAAGVDLTLDAWEDMLHVWQAYPMIPEAHRAVERVGAFLREKTALG